MTCYHPITVCLPSTKDFEGKRRLIFNQDIVKKYSIIDDSPLLRDKVDSDIINGFKIQIPCGKCIGCRLDYSRMWAIRAVHESMLHDKSSFVTLTFDNDHMPDDCSLHKEYISSWMKRFRKKFGDGIRYMLCGEYGEKFGRPHYHILFFNFDFPDKKYWSQRNGQIYYRSSMLEDVWRDACSSESNGYSIIGDLSFESSAYVARYVTKKLDGDLADQKYNGREKEFLNMSRMPGIGHDFIVKNYKHIFDNNFVVLPNGHKAPIPRYYWDILKQTHPVYYDRKYLDKYHDMVNNLFIPDLDKTQQRLEAREELQKLKLDKLVRAYEFDANLHNIY